MLIESLFWVKFAANFEHYESLPYPVFPVDVLVRVPLSSEEGVLLADDLSIEECGQLKRGKKDQGGPTYK